MKYEVKTYDLTGNQWDAMGFDYVVDALPYFAKQVTRARAYRVEILCEGVIETLHVIGGVKEKK